MSLRHQIFSLIAAFFVIGLGLSYAFNNNSTNRHLDQILWNLIESEAKIIGELWQSGKGCTSNQTAGLDTLDDYFFAGTGLAYQITCPETGWSANSKHYPNFQTVTEKQQDQENEYYYRKDVDGDNWLVAEIGINDGNIKVARVNPDDWSIGYLYEVGDGLKLGLALLTILALIYAAANWPLRNLKSLRLGLTDNSHDIVNDIKLPIELENLRKGLLFEVSNNQNLNNSKDASLEREKRFTANASHELLTPLAAIKTEVQLQRRITEDEGLKNWLDEVLIRVNRATHTVDQLMTLARIEPDVGQIPMQSVELGIFLPEIVEDIEAKYSEKSLNISQNIVKNSRILAVPTLLNTLVRNLIINACKYAPESSNVEITAQLKTEDTVIVTISNDCQKLPEYLLDHMFDRFVRGPYEIESGSGLGLPICKRIAEIHNTELRTSIVPNREKISFSFALNLAPGEQE